MEKIQREFLIGCMLGDGNIKIPSGCKNAMFQCQHGPKQIEYNKWKCELLSSLGSKFYTYTRKTPNKKTNRFYEANITATKCNKELTEIYKMFYKNKKKTITKEILEEFTTFSLAVLFMDDGSKTTQSQYGTYTIASCGFDLESLGIFQAFLKNKFNIDTSITHDNRIYIKVNSKNLFEYLVKPHIQKIPSMLYKLYVS